MRFIRTAQSQRHPDVTVRIVLGAEREFVPLGVTPVARQRVITVRHSVTVDVGNAGNFTPSGGRHRAVLPREREDFILTAGEQMILRRGRSLERAFDKIDVTTPRAHRKPSVRKVLKTARPHRDPGRNWDIDDWVVFRLLRSRAPHGSELFLRGQA